MKGKTNFEGFFIRIKDGDRGICRGKMNVHDSFDDVSEDIYAYLIKEKRI